jgi:hypothetical protein
MTQKQKSQQQLILGWTYLTENHHDNGESIFGDCLNRIKNRCLSMFRFEGTTPHELLDQDSPEIEGVGNATIEEL